MTWRDVPGYEGWYQVSDAGEVRSVTREIQHGERTRHREGRILKQHPVTDGYLTVTLCVDSVRRSVGVHRLVAWAFIGPQAPGIEVRHMDGELTHNALANLQYGTRAENQQDRLRHGTSRRNATHCDQGHEWTDENTAWQGGGRWRTCKKCRRARERRRRATK